MIALYHFMYPDDVVSGRIFDGCCVGLVQRGWEVEAWPSNRSWQGGSRCFAREEVFSGVKIRRVWRPPLAQESGSGRFLNSVWMICAWWLRLLTVRDADRTIIVVGSDPVLGVMAAFATKLRPRLKVVHWCFDLYPDAAIADGVLSGSSPFTAFLRWLLRSAYSACSLVACIGDDMRRHLEQAGAKRRLVMLTTWALVEPAKTPSADVSKKKAMFGDAALGILYSGNFGRAHCADRILKLARSMRHLPVCFAFAVRGNGVAGLRSAITQEDTNVRLVDFVGENELPGHLAVADIHIASLRPEWTGTVVPSKFFGSLAVGRPVIFEGSGESCIAGWIRQYGLGWILDSDESIDKIAADLAALVKERAALEDRQRRCLEVYRERFSANTVIDAWDRELRGLLNRE